MSEQFKLVSIIILASCALLGCGHGTVKTETHQTTNGQWSPPLVSITTDDMRQIARTLNPTNSEIEEIVIWTNAAGDKRLGITRDGRIWLRVDF